MDKHIDLPLFTNAVFHGAGYDAQKDHARLSGNLKKVHTFMHTSLQFNRKRTLREIATHTGVPEASASACLRTLRNQYGYVIEKDRIGKGGTWQYWIAGGGMGVHSRNPRKMKPIGDPELFGKMMQAIYAYAKDHSEDTGISMAMTETADAWAHDMAERIRKAGA